MNENTEFQEPFGDDWHTEMMCHKKVDLVMMLRLALQKIIDLEQFPTREELEGAMETASSTLEVELPFNINGEENA